jgi:allantoate deiminase
VSSRPLDGTAGTLAADLEAAAAIGADPEGGVTRLAWTSELAEATAWVAGKFEELGLRSEIDAAGNLIARWPASGGSAVMVGSHLDTVPRGGAFDGALGVLAALDAVRRLRGEGFEPARPIWVAAFMDEEGTRFGSSLFGSRAFCGEDLSPALDARDRDGTTVAAAMADVGLSAQRIAEAVGIDRVGSYIELHVEQGPILFSRGIRLGLVESICGVLGYRVSLRGETNHAGTTPMDMRGDAVVGAARAVLGLRDRAMLRDDLRVTVGKINALPGARNVVAGECEFSVDLRPVTPEAFAGHEPWLRDVIERAAAQEGLAASIVCEYALEPTIMDPGVLDALAAAAEQEAIEPLRMSSGAGHDAMILGRHVPAGMLFVPSRDGVSHSPRVWTDPADCELGARVLANALRIMAC